MCQCRRKEIWLSNSCAICVGVWDWKWHSEESKLWTSYPQSQDFDSAPKSGMGIRVQRCLHSLDRTLVEIAPWVGKNERMWQCYCYWGHFVKQRRGNSARPCSQISLPLSNSLSSALILLPIQCVCVCWPIKLTSELFSPIGSTWVYSVHFSLIRSILVLFGLFCPRRSTSVLSSTVNDRFTKQFSGKICWIVTF